MIEMGMILTALLVTCILASGFSYILGRMFAINAMLMAKTVFLVLIGSALTAVLWEGSTFFAMDWMLEGVACDSNQSDCDDLFLGLVPSVSIVVIALTGSFFSLSIISHLFSEYSLKSTVQRFELEPKSESMELNLKKVALDAFSIGTLISIVYKRDWFLDYGFWVVVVLDVLVVIAALYAWSIKRSAPKAINT